MTFKLVELIHYFFLQIILTRLTTIFKFFSTSNFPNSNFTHLFSIQHSKIPIELKTTHDPKPSRTHLSFTKATNTIDTTVDEDGIRADDLELLMAKLGVEGHGEKLKLPEVLSFTDVFNVFEEEEPRLDEVKEAFDVFDENRDGFIDAVELQRVLSVLGLKGSREMEDCRKMIGAFDENADGRIDFREFVKVMESTCF